MRHRKKGRKLGVNPSHRRALLSNMAENLILHKRIKTTESRAKELRRYIEPLITKAKKASGVVDVLTGKDIVNDKELKSLISEIESDLTVGRVLVRPSGTEPKIRIMIEASEEKVAKKFANDIKKIIESKS